MALSPVVLCIRNYYIVHVRSIVFCAKRPTGEQFYTWSVSNRKISISAAFDCASLHAARRSLCHVRHGC